MGNISPIGNRETVADGLQLFSIDNQTWLELLMESPANDDILLDGLHVYLDRASEARFLNSIKLETCGHWLGNTAPARLQMRLSEAAKSSQHPAYGAFRAGLSKSGGMGRAYPKSPV